MRNIEVKTQFIPCYTSANDVQFDIYTEHRIQKATTSFQKKKKTQKLFTLLRFFPYASPFCNLSLASVHFLSRCFSTYWPTMLSISSIPLKVLLFYIYKESVACEFSVVFLALTADIFHILCRVRIWQTLSLCLTFLA